MVKQKQNLFAQYQAFQLLNMIESMSMKSPEQEKTNMLLPIKR